MNPQAEARVGRQRQVEVRSEPAVLRQGPVPEKQHSTIPDAAFLFVFNVALLLFNGIQDYIGLDHIKENGVHRLKSMNNFRKYGMLKRIYEQMVALSGDFSVHYHWNEWANAFVVKCVLKKELDHLCDTRVLRCPYMHSCELDAEARAQIVAIAMRSWLFYRNDAIQQLADEMQVQAVACHARELHQ